MKIRVPSRWQQEPSSILVSRFFEAYAAKHQKFLDDSQYQLVDVRAMIAIDRHEPLGNVDDGLFCVARLDVEEVTEQQEEKEKEEDPFDLYCEAYCLFVYGQQVKTDPTLSYMRTKMRLRGKQKKVRKAPRERLVDPATEGLSSSSEEEVENIVARDEIRRVKTSKKDWDQINFRKCLCPHVVAGRRCPRGSANCSYAHTFEDLRRENPAVSKKPGVCSSSTAHHRLGPPELWQLGVFAEPSRRQPNLWSRMTKRDKLRTLAAHIKANHDDQ